MCAPLARASLRSIVGGHVPCPRGARRAPSVARQRLRPHRPLTSSPLRGPCQVFSPLQGVFIKPHAALQSFPSPQSENPALWSHGEELRGTVQARATYTGNRQQLSGSKSRGPVRNKERQIMATKHARSDQEMQITLQTMALQFGVDITPARGLRGSELEAWLNQAEDELFDQLCSGLNEQD